MREEEGGMRELRKKTGGDWPALVVNESES